MAPRDIERFNIDYSFDEVALRWGKQLCFAFAAIAIALGVLDLCGVHSVGAAGNFWAAASVRIMTLGDRIRHGVSDLALLGGRDGGDVIVSIPASTAPTRIQPSAIDRLADVRRRDAIEFAMTTPTAVLPQESAVGETRIAPPAAAAMSAGDAATDSPASRDPAVAAASVPVAASNPSEPVSSDMFQIATVTTGVDQQLQSIAPKPVPAMLPDVGMALIPLHLIPLPRAAPPPSPAEILKLTGKDYAKAQRCLANAIYFEARSEPLRGQMAVAQVVLNRVFSGFYPDNVCDVVYQNAHRRLACQFTFACDGKSKAIHDRGSWARANRIATQTLDGQIYLPEVAKSTHYHATYVHPVWVREMKRLARHGLHLFYRPFAWGSGAEIPVWGQILTPADSTKKKNK